MKVIICGAGRVGSQIAQRLAQEGNDVTVIDTDPALVKRVTDEYDLGGVVGHASRPDIQQKAGAADADMLIAATHLDEVNMVACQVAHSVFTVPRRIARIRAQSYLQPQWSDLFRRDHMPIDVVISPELSVAQVALTRLNANAAFETQSFLDDQARLVGVTLLSDCPVLNTPLRQLSELFSSLRARVVAIRRASKLLVPDPDDQLYAEDAVYFAAAAEDVARAMRIFGRESRKLKRVVLIGAGNVGLSLAELIETEGQGLRAKLIEIDQTRAEFAADKLRRTVILNGDALEPAILDEAGAGDADAAVALTDDDRVNLLACALARQAGCPFTVALTNDSVFATLADDLGVDAHITPRATTVSNILRHVRRGRVRSVYSVGEGEGEAIEAQVLATSPIANRRLREVDFPPGAIVGAVLQRDGLKMPSGDLQIVEGDLLLVFALRDAVKQVEQLFRVSIDFF